MLEKIALLGVRSPCFPPFLLLAPTLHCKIEAKKLLKMKLSSWKSYYIYVVWNFITPGCTALSIKSFSICFVFEHSVFKTKQLRSLMQSIVHEFDWLKPNTSAHPNPKSLSLTDLSYEPHYESKYTKTFRPTDILHRFTKF